MEPPTRLGVAVMLAGLFSADALAQAPSFALTGFAPGTAGSKAYALSADGTVAAGFSLSNTIAPGFEWSAASGRNDFGLGAGLPAFTQCFAISGDGLTFAGFAGGNGQNQIAFRWSGPGTYQTLGALAFPNSKAEGVSGDGSVIVGHSYVQNNFGGEAFRWTAGTGMVGIGYTRPGNVLSDALAISRNGNAIVGFSMDASGYTDAFVWTASTGMQILPQLPDTPSPLSGAAGVNFDGTIVVGSSGAVQTATIWRNGVPSSLGIPNGFNHTLARAVNDDGSVVVGLLGSAHPVAGVWTLATGMVTLDSYLTANGVVIPTGWTTLDCTAVSHDGLTFAGIAGFGGQRQGFVASVPPPCPADYDRDGHIAPSDVAAFVNAWFASLVGGTLTGDFDGNGQVQPADVSVFIGAWFNALANGC